MARYFLLSKSSRQHWISNKLLFNNYRGLDSGKKSGNLMKRLRISGAVPSLLPTCYIFMALSPYSLISIQAWRPGLAGTRAQSCDRYGSGILHPGQVLWGSLLFSLYTLKKINSLSDTLCRRDTTVVNIIKLQFNLLIGSCNICGDDCSFTSGFYRVFVSSYP